MYKFLHLIALSIILVNWVDGQYQQQQQFGIKTHYPSANLVNNNTANQLYPTLPIGNPNYRQPVNASAINRAQLVNYTSTPTITQSGICSKEVPTASLVTQRGVIVPAGNGSNPSLSRIQVCCAGYERNQHNFQKCDPVCTTPCVNSLCISPETCKCYPDYVRNLAGVCTATCPIGCENGHCLPDKTCVCNSGYTLDSTRKLCIPKCSSGCLNGVCAGPEMCSCNKGYQLNVQLRRCVPICAAGCINGECIAPDVCSCAPGYVKRGNTCEAICSRGCVNGQCVAPEVCTCNTGWKLDGTGTACIASCDQICMNGLCSAYNTCTCHRGYILDSTDRFKCIPYCPSGCPNGVCSSPGFCICKAGFVKDRSVKGSQACVPSTIY